MRRRHLLSRVLFVALVLLAASCQLESDDFTSAELGSRWTIIDPLGDGEVTGGFSSDGSATLDLTIPAGTPHDAWTPNDALRVQQSVDDDDTTIEVAFDSVPSLRYQSEGLIFQEDVDSFLRFDYFSNGTNLRAHAVAIDDGVATTLRNVVVPGGPELHLRVGRVGDTWTMETSVDGEAWTQRLTTERVMTLDAIAVFAGNAASSGQPAPGWTARVDHIENLQHPLETHDGTGEPGDVIPPEISDLTIDVGATGASVEWSTDEPTTGLVEVGTTPALELGATPSGSSGLSHQVDLAGLSPETDYHLRVTATDVADNTTTSSIIPITTLAATGPTIELWYGDSQEVGTPGRPQTWVNLLGNVTNPGEIGSFTYRLNDGPASPLSLGPDTRRLLEAGDFNVEIDADDLEPGDNTLELLATDAIGTPIARTIHVLATTDETWPLPYATSWGEASSVTDQAQVIDGRWSLDGDEVSPDAVGYDRLVAIGDRSWSEYEVTVPVTLLALEPFDQPPSNGAALGLLVHWQGHVAVGSEQPRRGYEPLGAYASFRWGANDNDRWQIVGSNNQPQASQSAPDWQVGETWVLKVRSESIAGGTRFQMRFWPEGTPEPGTWLLSIDDPDTNPSGSVVLLAHHVDAAFGDVSVVPIGESAGG